MRLEPTCTRGTWPAWESRRYARSNGRRSERTRYDHAHAGAGAGDRLPGGFLLRLVLREAAALGARRIDLAPRRALPLPEGAGGRNGDGGGDRNGVGVLDR